MSEASSRFGSSTKLNFDLPDRKRMTLVSTARVLSGQLLLFPVNMSHAWNLVELVDNLKMKRNWAVQRRDRRHQGAFEVFDGIDLLHLVTVVYYLTLYWYFRII